MERHPWSKLNKLQVGRYAEYFVKMELTRYGLDVYTAEVDDKGIDFVVRKSAEEYFDIQVKSLRQFNYIYARGKYFEARHNLHMAVLLLFDGEEPKAFLIPSLAWLDDNPALVRRENKDGSHEWGINLSKKNLPLIERYDFGKMVGELARQ